MNRTERIEATRKLVRHDEFSKARKALGCLEVQADRRKCLSCPLYALCGRLGDSITKMIEF